MKQTLIIIAALFVLVMAGFVWISPSRPKINVDSVHVPQSFVFDSAQTAAGSNTISDPKISLRMYGQDLVVNAIEFAPTYEQVWSSSPVFLHGGFASTMLWNEAIHLEEIKPKLDQLGSGWQVFGNTLSVRMDGPHVRISYRGINKTINTAGVCQNPDSSSILVNLMHQSVYTSGNNAYLPFVCNNTDGQWVFVIKINESMTVKEAVTQ